MEQTKERRTHRARRVLEIALGIGLAVALVWGTTALHRQQELADRVVRLHILANSDSEEDQALKLQVRDRILDRATEILEQSKNRQRRKLRCAPNCRSFSILRQRKLPPGGTTILSRRSWLRPLFQPGNTTILPSPPEIIWR